MGFSAFQPAYQHSAYQVIPTVGRPYTGGGSPDNHYWDRVKDAIRDDDRIRKLNEVERERIKAEQELALKEREIENLELKRLKALANQELQEQLLALLMEAQRLEQERLYLEGLVKWLRMQEDDIMVILMSLPFVG